MTWQKKPEETSTAETLDLDHLKASTDASIAFTRSLVESWLPQDSFQTSTRSTGLDTVSTGRPAGLGLGAVMTKGYQARNQSALSRIDPRRAKQKQDENRGARPAVARAAVQESDEEESRSSLVGSGGSKRYRRGSKLI